MANGIAWESKRPTLCLVITSVGVYGLMQALYAACVNRRPVVVLSGEVSGIGCGSVQAGEGWDGPSVTQATRPFTAWSVDAVRADQRYSKLGFSTDPGGPAATPPSAT
jgi:thiamine pyrophosphate-dependent acetolactate synthase large subunit-like protein